MKFSLGLPPEAESSSAEEGCWRLVKEPGILAVQFIGVIAGLCMVGLILAVLFIRRGSDLSEVSWPAVIVLFLPATPIHELIHASLFPGGPLTEKVTLGFYPRAVGCYAHFDGLLSRSRYVLICAGPLLVLTLLPLSVLTVFTPGWPYLLEFILANGLLSSVDILTIMFILKQVPRDSVLVNSGTETYWKVSCNTPTKLGDDR